MASLSLHVSLIREYFISGKGDALFGRNVMSLKENTLE